MGALGEAKDFIDKTARDLGPRFSDFVEKSGNLFGAVAESAAAGVHAVGSGIMALTYTVGKTALDIGAAASIAVGPQGPAGVADWFDRRAAETKDILGNVVQNHPSFPSVVAATAVATAVDLGRGQVDMLRLGQGAAQGGLVGYGTDGLRLVGLATTIAPGVNAVARTSVRIGRTALARMVADPGGGVCAFMSTAQALKQTGARTFASFDDILSAVGKVRGKSYSVKELEDIAPRRLSEMFPLWDDLGLKYRQLAVPSNEEALKQMVMSRPDGVVMFGTKWLIKTKDGTSKWVGHALYAHRNVFGKFEIVDRGSRRFFSSMSELNKTKPGYGGIGRGVITDAVFLPAMKIPSVITGQGARLTGALTLPMRTVVLPNRETANEAVKYYQKTGQKFPASLGPYPW